MQFFFARNCILSVFHHTVVLSFRNITFLVKLWLNTQFRMGSPLQFSKCFDTHHIIIIYNYIVIYIYLKNIFPVFPHKTIYIFLRTEVIPFLTIIVYLESNSGPGRKYVKLMNGCVIPGLNEFIPNYPLNFISKKK